ncbi:MAG TPA: helix-turn-helix domain-containing protein [Acidobacteriaceae bacterium]
MSLISTKSMHTQDKLAQWQQSAWMETGHARSRWIQATSFDGFLEFGSLGEIKLYKLTVTPHRVMSSTEVGTQNVRGLVKAILQVRGTTHYEQMGRQVLLKPGSWMLRDMDMPYSIDIQEHSELIALIFPKTSIASTRFDIRDFCLRLFSGTSGLGHIVHDLIQDTFQEFGEIEESLLPDLASTITQLIRLHLLQVCPDQTPQALCEVLRERVRRYISVHLRAPDLSLDQIARAMHCTKRYLHKVFEEEDMSISKYILDQRLDRCRDALCGTSGRDECITDIALSWGFSNSAHFSRAFHKRFGVSPSAYRVSCFSNLEPMRRLPSIAGQFGSNN